MQDDSMLDRMIDSLSAKKDGKPDPFDVQMSDGAEYHVDENGTWRRKNKKMNKWERKKAKKA